MRQLENMLVDKELQVLVGFPPGKIWMPTEFVFRRELELRWFQFKA
jgi:hypothetical protein